MRTTTTNGAGAFTSTSNPLIDLFFNIGASRNNIDGIKKDFSTAFKYNPLKATAIMLWARDIRHNGAGERKVFRTLFKELLSTGSYHTERVLSLIPEIGRFDDLKVAYGTSYQELATLIWINAIREKNILAAKWAKREDKVLQRALGLNEAGLRKLLSSIRKNAIPEAKMCANEWDKIEYDKIPSVCGMRHAKAFMKHDGERYRAFIDSKDTKVNATVAFPHDVYRMYRYGNQSDAASKYWENLPNLELVGNILPMVDVSGSMLCPASGMISCMDVAISLGTYLSQQIEGKFKNTMLTFSGSPDIVTIPNSKNINKIFDFVGSMRWGMNTDIKKAYEKILSMASNVNATQKDMPEYILIMSDMQFDSCTGTFGTNPTIHEDMKKKFANAGYKLPKIIFWNLNAGYYNFPTSSFQKDVALVSGFSPSVMKAVLMAKEVTPTSIMEEAIAPFVEMLR